MASTRRGAVKEDGDGSSSLAAATLASRLSKRTGLLEGLRVSVLAQGGAGRRHCFEDPVDFRAAEPSLAQRGCAAGQGAYSMAATTPLTALVTQLNGGLGLGRPVPAMATKR